MSPRCASASSGCASDLADSLQGLQSLAQTWRSSRTRCAPFSRIGSAECHATLEVGERLKLQSNCIASRCVVSVRRRQDRGRCGIDRTSQCIGLRGIPDAGEAIEPPDRVRIERACRFYLLRHMHTKHECDRRTSNAVQASSPPTAKRRHGRGARTARRDNMWFALSTPAKRV